MTDTTDPELVAMVRGGSRDAVVELFRRHWASTWRAAFGLCGRRAMADDMAQDAFERAMGGLATFNGHSSFGTWVQRIAVNRTIDQLRRERRLGELTDDLEGPVERAERSHGDPALMRAVGRLVPERRVPVVLRYWFDYTPAEIAEVLGIPVGTVSSRLSRALDELRTARHALPDRAERPRARRAVSRRHGCALQRSGGCEGRSARALPLDTPVAATRSQATNTHGPPEAMLEARG